MYKRIYMEETNQGEQHLLVYLTDEMDKLDFVEMEILKNNKIEGVLSFSFLQKNEEVECLYNVSKLMKISQYLGGIVRWEDLYPALQGIAKTLFDSQKYMLDEQHFVLDSDYIYIDVETRKPLLIFLPVNDERIENVSWVEYFLQLLSELNYDKRDNSNYVNRVRNYLADKDMTIKEFVEKLKHLPKTGRTISRSPVATEHEGSVVQNAVSSPMQTNKEDAANIIVNVPKSEETIKVKEKSEKKLGLFSKKNKKQEKSTGKEKTFGFDIPGQKVVKKKTSVNETPEMDKTVLMEEQPEEVFVPYLTEKKNGTEILINKTDFKIGRGQQYVDYVVEEPTVGRFHASFTVDKETKMTFVRDANSKNGTYVNNKRIQSNINVALEDGMLIRFGKEEFVFHVR